MAFTSKNRRVKVLDSYIAYVDTRAGEYTAVFLHGNPTYSYLWRNVIPHVQGVARCLAPDLLGMGHSGKHPKFSYRFSEHYRYLNAWFEAVQLPGKIVLVVHEWGSALGFQWAASHPDRVAAIIHMESFVAPFASYQELGTKVSQEFFRRMRHGQDSESLVLQHNYYLEMCLAGVTITRKLNEVDFAAYREPYLKPGESRRPTLTWTSELPIEGDGPDDVIQIVKGYSRWLANSDDLPKLLVVAKPGLFSDWVQKKTKDWPNQRTVCLPGRHFVQEESPDELGHAIAEFIKDALDR